MSRATEASFLVDKENPDRANLSGCILVLPHVCARHGRSAPAEAEADACEAESEHQQFGRFLHNVIVEGKSPPAPDHSDASEDPPPAGQDERVVPPSVENPGLAEMPGSGRGSL